MADRRNPVNQVVRVQEVASPTGMSDQQLAIHKVVPGGFVSLEQPVQFDSIGRAVGQKTDPDGSVYEDHRSHRSLLRVSGLRRGTSVAPLSEPLSFRSLS